MTCVQPIARASGARTDVVDIGQGGLNVAGVTDPALRGAETDRGEVSGQSTKKKQDYSGAKCELGSPPLRHSLVHRSFAFDVPSTEKL